jgi:hypothetical protein
MTLKVDWPTVPTQMLLVSADGRVKSGDPVGWLETTVQLTVPRVLAIV